MSSRKLKFPAATKNTYRKQKHRWKTKIQTYKCPFKNKWCHLNALYFSCLYWSEYCGAAGRSSPSWPLGWRFSSSYLIIFHVMSISVPAHCHIELPELLWTRLHASAQLATLPRNSRSLHIYSLEPGSFTFVLFATCLTVFTLPDKAEFHRCSQQESRRWHKVCLTHYTALLEILQVQA